jgi:hypothetical protein
MQFYGLQNRVEMKKTGKVQGAEQLLQLGKSSRKIN